MILNGRPIDNEKGLVAYRPEEVENAIQDAYKKGYADAVIEIETAQKAAKSKTKAKLTVNGEEAEYRATAEE